MRKLKNEINLDRAVDAAENTSMGEKTMNNSSKKTPWRLRFAGAILAVAGILLALSGREIQSQSNSPTDNSPTNSVPQPQGPRIFGQHPRGWNAMDCDDCDTVYNEKIKNLTDARDNAIDAALKKYSTAIADATEIYRTAVQLENAKFNGDMAQADAEFLRTLETECTAYTLTGAVTLWGGATYVGKKAFQRIRVRTMAILRSGALLVGGVATSIICVRVEQRVYDARTESLMGTHAL